MRITIAALLLAVSFPAGAFSAANEKATDPNAVVCQRFKMTETRTKTQKVCRTRAEWTRSADETRRKFLEDAQNGGAKINFEKGN
jgi:hypothetical protein